MSRALLLLTLLLTVGEVTGLLDAALQQDCASCTTSDDGCMLCPCCHQGRLACSADAPSLPAPIAAERVSPRAGRPVPAAVSARIFHPPRSTQG